MVYAIILLFNKKKNFQNNCNYITHFIVHFYFYHNKLFFLTKAGMVTMYLNL